MQNNFLKLMREKTLQRIQTDVKVNEVIFARQPYPFAEAFKLSSAPAAIMAELKFATPLSGAFSKQKRAALDLAEQYLKHGACALSVLTEPDYFKGSLTSLASIRKAFPAAPILMKDFILAESQLLQARHLGADAILLIAAFLSAEELEKLYKKALSLGLSPLVEIHTEADLYLAKALDAKSIIVNTRNLKTLSLDYTVPKKLIPELKNAELVIAASGIHSAKNIRELQKLGFQGFLIGSHFMRQDCPGEALKALLAEVAQDEN